MTAMATIEWNTKKGLGVTPWMCCSAGGGMRDAAHEEGVWMEPWEGSSFRTKYNDVNAASIGAFPTEPEAA